MVRAIDKEPAQHRSSPFHFRGSHDNAEERQAQSSSNQNSESLTNVALTHEPLDKQRIGSALNLDEGADSADMEMMKERFARLLQDMEMMKERFAKLLLGEDNSGGGKGVSSALALSNAFTNLAASTFGEQKRLEPMAPDRKARWRKEINWLLSVTDHIVEFVPSKQKSKDGASMEVMTKKQRTDLQMNVPALRKLDAMLIDCLENFKDQNEFTYVSGDDESEKGKNNRKDDKWWIPTPKVPPNGLSEVTRKWLQFQKESVNQVLKAAMAINAQVLSEMEIPENYIDTLPKNGRASLGDSIYRNITVGDYFDPYHFLSMMDLSSEHKILDLKNKIEASVVIWKRKMTAKDGKSAWSSAVSMEKRELFEERAETILLLIKQRFPGIPQSALEISKIQYNRDVGQAVLESYSRVLESLAFTVMARIEDVILTDNLAQNPSLGEQKRNHLRDSSPVMGADTFPSTKGDGPGSMTLLDFMGWDMDRGETETDKELVDDLLRENDSKSISKPPNIVTNKKFSYIEKLEHLGGLRSPRARH